MDIDFVIRSIVAGVVATIVMDIWGGIGHVLGVVRHPPLGRWVMSMAKGRFRHDDILRSPPVKGEKLMAPVVHYLIGVALAGIYLLVLGWLSYGDGSLLTALVYGFVTTVLPWLWLFPAMGYGAFGLKGSPRYFLLRQSILNHLAYGFGLWAGVLVLGAQLRLI